MATKRKQRRNPDEESRKQRVRDEIVTSVVVLLTASMGTVAALAWDDAIRTILDKYYPLYGEGIPVKLVYAGSLTLITVTASIMVARAAGRGELVGSILPSGATQE